MSHEQTFDMVGHGTGSPECPNNNQEFDEGGTDYMLLEDFREECFDASSRDEAVSNSIDEHANENDTAANGTLYQIADEQQSHEASVVPATASTSIQRSLSYLDNWLVNSEYAATFADGPPDCAFEAYGDGKDIDFYHFGKYHLGTGFWGPSSELYWADKNYTTELYRKAVTKGKSKLRLEVAQEQGPNPNPCPPLSAPVFRSSCWDDDEETDNAELTDFIRRNSTGNIADRAPIDQDHELESTGAAESLSNSARSVDGGGDTSMGGTTPFGPSGGNGTTERPASRRGFASQDGIAGTDRSGQDDPYTTSSSSATQPPSASSGQEPNQSGTQANGVVPDSPTPSNASSVDSVTGMTQTEGVDFSRSYYSDERPSLAKSRAQLKDNAAGNEAVDRLPEAPRQDRIDLLSAKVHRLRQQRDQCGAFADRLEDQFIDSQLKLEQFEAKANGWRQDVEDFQRIANESNENCEAAVLARRNAEASLAQAQAAIEEVRRERDELEAGLEEQQNQVKEQRSAVKQLEEELAAANEEVQELLEMNYQLRQTQNNLVDAETQTESPQVEQDTQATPTQNEIPTSRSQTTDAMSQTERRGVDQGTQTDFDDAAPSSSSSTPDSDSDSDSDFDSDSLAPDDCVRWHPARIDEIAERIAEWVTATHAREDRRNLLTCTADQVRKILGDGTTSFRSLHDQLRQLGFMFRHDRFARFIEKLTRDVQGTTSLEAMDIARDYNTDRHPRRRALEDLDRHIREFQGGQAHHGLIVDNCNLRDKLTGVQRELEECHAHGRQLRRELTEQTDLAKEVLAQLDSKHEGGEDNGQKKLADLTKQLAECHEHGRKLEMELQQTKQMVKNLGKEVESCTEAGDNNDETLKSALDKLAQSDERRRQLQQELEETQQALSEVTSLMNSDDEGSSQADEDKLAVLEAKLRQCHEHGQEISEEREILKMKLEKLQGVLSKVKEENVRLQDRADDLEAIRQSLEDRCAKLTDEMEQIQINASINDAAEQQDEPSESYDESVPRSELVNASNEIAELKQKENRHLAMLAAAKQAIDYLQAQVAEGINRRPSIIIESAADVVAAQSTSLPPSSDSQETPPSSRNFQQPPRRTAFELRIMQTAGYQRTAEALRKKREAEAKLRTEERQLRQQAYKHITGSSQIPYMTRVDRMEALQRLIAV